MRLLASLTILVFASIASADRKPKPPHGATRIAIDYEFTSFQRDERHYVIEWAKSGGYRTGSRAVDPKLVDALYASLTALRAADEPLRCISHTDDYPRFTVTVEGSEPLEVSTQSNCHGYVPWNIKRDGKQLVQFTGAVGGAVHGLLAAAEPERWKTPFEGRHAMGFERVVVSHYAPGAVTTSAAGTCALDLKKRGRPVFGEQVKVAELDLACDLGESPDCTAVTARATIVWTGVEVAVDLACPRGKVDLATNVRARFEPVKKFLDSKPVRAMVRLAASAPRMWKSSTWQLNSSDLELPSLDWTPGSQVIGARIIGGDRPAGAKFWKALGLDPAKLPRRQDRDWHETNVKLDFTGRVIRSPGKP